MQLESDYLDFLQNIEFAVMEVFKENPDMGDPDVQRAYDRLVKFYQRKKKHLPETEVTLSGHARKVFDAAYAVCEWRRKKGPGEPIGLDGYKVIGNDVPIVAVVRSLEKLHKSVERWHKKDGHSGYLTFISGFIV